MPEKHRNIQRIPLRLFIPWDDSGRIYLNDHEYITRETDLKGGKVIKLPDGILLKGKK
jgi:hypothetical protein